MPDRLAPGVHRLRLGWPAPLGANAYLVDDVGEGQATADAGGATTLVDAGFPMNARCFRDELSALGLTPGDLDRVLITHYDLDHVGGLSRLVPDLDAPVYVGAADLDLMDGRADPPLLHHKGLFHRGLRRLFRVPASLPLRPVADGDRIGGFTAFHTPGHNPGHTVYVHEGRRAALLGDLVWEDGGELTTPIWFDSYDMREVRASIRRLAAESPAFDLACVGHGEPLRSDGSDALRALADRLDDVSDWLP